MSRHQEQAMRLGLERTRREMLVGGQGPLAKVEAERRLVLGAGRGFEQAVREARAEGFTWDQIAEHAPGFTGAFAAEAAEKLFQSVSVPGSRLGDRYASWRCGDCDGLVLDRGPSGGHPADAEPGHREDCGRLGTEIEAYVARLDDTDPAERLSGGIASAVTEHRCRFGFGRQKSMNRDSTSDETRPARAPRTQRQRYRHRHRHRQRQRQR